METEKKIISGLVEKIEDGLFTTEDSRQYPISALFIRSNPLDVVEFPKRFSEQEKGMVLGKQVLYVRVRGFGSEYQLEILDEPYKGWNITGKLD